MHTINASSSGWAPAQEVTALSAFSPALQPMPTTSSLPVSGRSPRSLISRALNPGVRKPVVVTQHR